MLLLAASSVVSGSRALAQSPDPVFLPLGNRSLVDVSSNGTYVVGNAFYNDFVQPYRLSTATLQLTYLGHLDYDAFATAISSNGQVVVGNSAWEVEEEGHYTTGFRWTSSTGMRGMTYGSLGDWFNSSAAGISSDGSTIVGQAYGHDVDFVAVRLSPGIRMLPPFSGGLPNWDHPTSGATAASGNGSVIVGWSNGDHGAFRWTAATGMVGLGNLPGAEYGSSATSVSADGLTVVGNGPSAIGRQAFRWTAATGMVGLGDLPGGTFESTATGVSPNGSVIVGNGHDANGWQAFRWSASTGMIPLKQYLVEHYSYLLPTDFDQWNLTSAMKMCGDGTAILGAGTDPAGNYQNWIFRVQPLYGTDVSWGAMVPNQKPFKFVPDHVSNWSSLGKVGGRSFVIANAWDGQNVLPAKNNLTLSSNLGMKNLAAYAQINFTNDAPSLPAAPAGTDQRGDYQISQAFYSVTGVPIRFMAIAVEKGSPVLNNGQPILLPDGTATYTNHRGILTKDEQIKRIADAVQAVRDRGIPAVIITGKSDWGLITGGVEASAGTSEFSSVPLWDVTPTAQPAAPPSLSSFTKYGGWAERIGLRYTSDTSLSDIPVDLDVFSPDSFTLATPHGTPKVEIQGVVFQRSGTLLKVNFRVKNTGDAEALAVRLWTATLDSSSPVTVALPIRVGTIPAGESRNVSLTFKDVPPGTNIVRLRGTLGGAQFAGSFRVTGI